MAPATIPEAPRESPKPITPPPPDPSWPDLEAALQPLELGENDGISERTDLYAFELSWPRFNLPNAALNRELATTLGEMARRGAHLEEGRLEEGTSNETGGCKARISRREVVSVMCHNTYEDEDCDVPVYGKTWRVREDRLEALLLRSAFRHPDDGSLRSLCEQAADASGLPRGGLCTENRLRLVLADEGIVVVPEVTCPNLADGILLDFEEVEPHYDPDSPLVPLLRQLQRELDE